VETLVPSRFRGNHSLYRDEYAVNGRVRPMGQGLDLYGLRRDGREFPVEISLSPLKTTEGLLITAVIRDVTERQFVERRAQALAMIVESSQDAILAQALDGTITFWNVAAARMYGYSAAEAIGQHISLLAPPDKIREVDTLLARLRAGERVDHFEALRRARSGALLDVDTLLWPIRERDGTVVGASAVSRDIAAHKQAEQRSAELYEQQRHVALTLQNALMGAVAPVPGLLSAGRYLPATQGAGVGGDWYDLIPLGAGRTGVLVGDVMGRGLEAATVMGRLRSAANALARTGMPPQQLMSSLEAVARDTPDQLTTCCYLIIDPRAGEVSGCSAGHLPVVLACPDGTVRRLPVPLSAPLGVGDIPHRQATVPVPAGATLALYTDGLVERRDRDIDAQITTLQHTLAKVVAAGPDLEDAADQLLAAFSPAASDPLDDVTLLLIQMPEEPLSATACTLAAEPRSAGTARARVRDTLTQWGVADLVDTACLLVTEVLTNAIQHARSPVELQLYLTASEVIVEVSDDSAQLPQRCLPDQEEESGRGLLLVEALAASWGARLAETGKTVWFTLAVVPPAGRDRTP
jgi:PAS domain S-box-containing protein